VADDDALTGNQDVVNNKWESGRLGVAWMGYEWITQDR
jgi:hypothetical protein